MQHHPPSCRHRSLPAPCACPPLSPNRHRAVPHQTGPARVQRRRPCSWVGLPPRGCPPRTVRRCQAERCSRPPSAPPRSRRRTSESDWPCLFGRSVLPSTCWIAQSRWVAHGSRISSVSPPLHPWRVSSRRSARRSALVQGRASPKEIERDPGSVKFRVRPEIADLDPARALAAVLATALRSPAVPRRTNIKQPTPRRFVSRFWLHERERTGSAIVVRTVPGAVALIETVPAVPARG